MNGVGGEATLWLSATQPNESRLNETVARLAVRWSVAEQWTLSGS